MSMIIQLSHPVSIDQVKPLEKTLSYEQASLAANTRRTYSVMWSKFIRWCHEHKLISLPASAETISLYLGDLGGKVSFSTIDSIIAAIEKAHEHQGMIISGNIDLYKRVRKGIRRIHKEKSSGAKEN